jgi:hypothetical protein
VVACFDGTYCCDITDDDLGDSAYECCNNNRGFKIDNMGRLFQDASANTTSIYTRTFTSSVYSSEKGASPTEKPPPSNGTSPDDRGSVASKNATPTSSTASETSSSSETEGMNHTSKVQMGAGISCGVILLAVTTGFYLRERKKRKLWQDIGAKQMAMSGWGPNPFEHRAELDAHAQPARAELAGDWI